MKVFHETAATHEHFFARSTLAVFFSLSTHEQWNRAYSWTAFIAHSWRLGECNADLISCSPKKFHLSRWLEHVLPRWTRYSRINYYPFIVHSWATHEPLMNSVHLACASWSRFWHLLIVRFLMTICILSKQTSDDNLLLLQRHEETRYLFAGICTRAGVTNESLMRRSWKSVIWTAGIWQDIGDNHS